MKLLLSIITFIFFGLSVQAEDVIYVNSSSRSYVKYDKKIVESDFNLGILDVRISDNTLMISAKREFNNVMNYWVKFEDGSDHIGQVGYKDDLSVFSYDFRTKPKEEIILVKEEGEISSMDEITYTEVVDTNVVLERLELVQQLKNEIKDIGVMENRFVFRLTAIRNDISYSYMVFEFHNKSGGVYIIDDIEFYYKESAQKGSVRSETGQKIRPILTNSVIAVGPGEKKLIAYCLPAYFANDKAILIVTVKEKQGSRTIDLKVPVKQISKAKNF